MAYSFNGNDLNSCIELCEKLYNGMFDNEGHFNTLFSSENGELNNSYIGATKDEFYYYRGYAVQEAVSSSVNDFTIYGSDYRTPFHVDDNNVRPFFALKHNIEQQFWLLTFYVGCKAQSSYPDWNFNNSRYGNANNNYDIALFSNTGYPLRSAYLNVTTGGESSSARVYTQQFDKNHSYSNFYNREYPNTREISVFDVYNYIYPWYYGKDLDNDRIKAVKFDTNIPCFDADDITSIEKWVNEGVRENEINTSKTATKYKLWIQGLDSPTYKLNWHNEELESQNFDFDKTMVKLSCGVHGSDGVFYHELENAEYNDGSVKFTWYDMDSLVNTNIIQNAINCIFSDNIIVYCVY